MTTFLSGTKTVSRLLRGNSKISSSLLCQSQSTNFLKVATTTIPTVRFQSTTSDDGVDVELEHYRGQWKTYGDIDSYRAGKFQIKTFNKISPQGLAKFSPSRYDVRASDQTASNAHAILLRSHKLQPSEVPNTVRAIARCGAGTNNVPVSDMTAAGIPVFNTPGANANAVKELVLCGMLLGARRVVDGVNHMKVLGGEGLARERVEKDKALFGGREVKGKTLAVIGLGHIGASTARDAARLGMNIVGYDPALSIESALKLPRRPMTLVNSLIEAVSGADFISLNIPYIKGEGGTHGVINAEVFEHMKPDAVLLNFARGELVDSDAVKAFLDANDDGRYISDFPDDKVWDHPNAVLLPHLGASTAEAEEAAAAMAAQTVCDFLETGTIKNSVNFPTVSLGARAPHTVRVCVVNRNYPGMLAKLLDHFGRADLNIVQQVNQSRGDIAYNVLDVDTENHPGVLDFKLLQQNITMEDGILSTRIIYGGLPGTGYAKNLEGEYFV